MLAVGFVTPWPYNCWKLKKHNQTTIKICIMIEQISTV